MSDRAPGVHHGARQVSLAGMCPASRLAPLLGIPVTVALMGNRIGTNSIIRFFIEHLLRECPSHMTARMGFGWMRSRQQMPCVYPEAASFISVYSCSFVVQLSLSCG